MWSRSAFERAGRWDELSASNQDGDLMMRALAVEVPLVSASTGAGYYRLAPSGHSSLASSRFTRRGILSRLRTLRKIAAWLQERGLLTDYLPPLHEAFPLIARDLCADEPDLRRTALAEAKRFRPRAARRLRRHAVRLGFQATRQAKRRARRLAGAVSRHLTGQGPAGRSEVVFGLLTAQTVGSEGSDALPPAAGLDGPAVSVVVPTFDRAHVLARAIDSALNQTMPDLEVLVVDDASTDATSETVAAYDDERLRYLVQPENRGVSAARNRGLREARGEFIAFLDSDDEWLPDKLAFQVARLRSLPEEVGLLYGGVANHDGREHRDTHLPSRRGAIYRDLLVFNPIHGTSSVVIRRSVVATAGFFDESLPAIEDYDCWLQVSRFLDVDYVDRPVSRYHDDTTADRRSLDVEANLEARRRFYRKHESEMRYLGVAHEFLLLSVRRHPANDDVSGARRLAAEAIRRSPSSIEAYRRLVGT